jgi:hypothetical protein
MKNILNFTSFLNEGKVKKDERIEILRDDTYLVVAPLTHVASCKYGAYTHWCSAAPGSGTEDSFDKSNTSVNQPNGSKLIYILRSDIKLTPEQRNKTDRYYHLTSDAENGELDEDTPEYEEYLELKYDDEALDMTKIAIDYNPKYGSYSMWSGNNIPLEGGLYSLPIDEYVIDAIKNFCERDSKQIKKVA